MEPKLQAAYYCGDPQRGAAMGRSSHGTPQGKIRLYKITLNSGGYDNGGAYWGIGPPSLFRAFGEGFEWFERAKTREEVKMKLLAKFPETKFYR